MLTDNLLYEPYETIEAQQIDEIKIGEYFKNISLINAEIDKQSSEELKRLI